MDIEEIALDPKQESGEGGGGGESFVEFNISESDLRELQEQKGLQLSKKITENYGSVDELCKRLGTNSQKGLNGDLEDIEERQKRFGCNYIKPKPAKPFYKFIWEAFTDVTLVILTVAAIVSLGLSFYHSPEILGENGTVSDPTKGLEWIEGAAILAAVIIIVFVTAINNWSKERQFRGLQKTIAFNQTFATLRSSEIVQLPTYELLVGDICLIKYGDTIPADGVIIHSNDIKVDESSLTGELELVKKGPTTDPLLLSGTHVMEGSGRMVVIAVGINSFVGRVMQLVGAASKKKRNSEVVTDEMSKDTNANYKDTGKKGEKDNDDEQDDEDEEFGMKSVLRYKLDKMAMHIGYAGLAAALATLVTLILKFSIETFVIEKLPWKQSYLQDFVSYIIISITVIVVAIPEGLPLAVLLSLAYSVKRMMADNNLVRHLDACETMGNATTICSDKTGTLTMNRMTVVTCYCSEEIYERTNSFRGFPKNVSELLEKAIAANTGYTSRVQFSSQLNAICRQIGNRTECALLGFLHDLGIDHEAARQRIPEHMIFKVYTFSSTKKRMSSVIPREDGGYHLFTKGAPEILIKRCRWMVGSNGVITSLSDAAQNRIIEEVIAPMASTGLRTLCLAFKNFIPRLDNENYEYNSYYDSPTDIDWENEEAVVTDLVCLSIVGIEDPLRPEVPKAIRRCQGAGITVRMVTGDDVNTARSIALKCGILDPKEEFLVMEGPEFNEKIRSQPKGEVVQELLDQIWPRLRVLARSTPEDKYNLVKGIIESKLYKTREVVAVTGDGTNDGPALKKADVGFAMGLAGTDVAKEASDIIIMDDNFSSIVKAVIWGRHVYDSIAKFLQFQLTVNIVAVTLTFIGACALADTPLKAIQMMWVNLLQDTLASLSLATESPNDELLNRKPYGRDQSIVSMTMLLNICLHSVYQLIILLSLVFVGEVFFDIDNGRETSMRGLPSQHFTIVFNALVMMTLFNEFNCRILDGSLNVFKGIMRSHLFIIIWISSFVLQVMIIQLGGYAFLVESLTAEQWLWCLLFGIGELIFAQIIVIFRNVLKLCRKRTVLEEDRNDSFVWRSQMSHKLLIASEA